MKRLKEPVSSIDDYIASYPEQVQDLLREVRVTIAKAAPMADEAMKYGLPTFVLGENLVHFGAFKKHIGFYPTPAGIEAFANELSVYASSKGAVQFPLDQPLPLKLMDKIVKFRVREAAERAKAKSRGTMKRDRGC